MSKDEGGVWGLQTLPAELHEVVEQALDIYRGRRPETPFDEAAFAPFACFMEQQIRPI